MYFKIHEEFQYKQSMSVEVSPDFRDYFKPLFTVILLLSKTSNMLFRQIKFPCTFELFKTVAYIHGIGKSL
jgi:hypothetical protein